MRYGHYTDSELKTFANWPFRCPSWDPMPDGKKNVVVLGCSHTWGVGLEENETWVHRVSKHNITRLRFWNLGQPGASAEACVRILYASEKVINPKIIIVCWPEISRRERLEGKLPRNIMGYDERLRHEDKETDTNNFLKSVFLLEKFAEKNGCKTFHCFAHDTVDLKKWNPELKVIQDYSLRNCWPYWDKFTARELYSEPSRARDGKHFGVDNHKRFANIIVERFGQKLR